MNLTSNFKLEEFACKDGTAVPAEYMGNVQELANNLQILREALGLPITIMSGFRTLSYNTKCGGEPKSQHLQAKAADIIVKGMTPKDVCERVKFLISTGKLKEGGVGLYQGWVHYDVRGTKARWGGA